MFPVGLASDPILSRREAFLQPKLTFKTGELDIVLMCDARARVILGKVTEIGWTEPDATMRAWTAWIQMASATEESVMSQR